MKLTDEQIDSIMEQAQVFASAWSLVGGVFDFGNSLETAEQEKADLRTMLGKLAAPTPTVAPDAAASAGVIAAAEAVIACDRACVLTDEHIDALENAIAIQRGTVELPAAQTDQFAHARNMVAQPDEPATSAASDMTLGERIAHVGGRENAAGYIEFGSVMAVDALIKCVLRDARTDEQGASDGAGLFADDDERALFIQTMEEFEDCNETATDDRLLMKWASAGLLECNNYLVTEKGKEAFDAARAASQGEKQ